MSAIPDIGQSTAVVRALIIQSREEKKNKNKKHIQNLIDSTALIHQKMQLWSNAYENEYALRLAVSATDYDYGSQEFFLARTDPRVRYTHVVAESDYLEDFSKGWEYTLRHFIERYKEAIQQQPKEEYLRKNKPITSALYPSSSKQGFEEEVKSDQREYYPIKIISYLKCHYCNLDFHDVKERREHELEWHV